jgi:hypothetical protein
MPLRPKIDLAAIEAGSATYAELRAKPQPARIADLIDRLDEVRGSKISFPGPLVFSWDPIYKLLVEEAEAAVDALLDAYENDQRLTPTFDYSRPWSTNYTPISVHEVVGMILGDILGIHASTPAELRAWWRQHHSTDRALHALEVLADDQATPEQWLEAADFLTLPAGTRWSNGVMSGGGICDPKADLVKLNGDELRNRKDPSVSGLLAKRTGTLIVLKPELACKMSVKAALWDLPGSLPTLHMAAAVESCRTDSLVTVARLSLGDAWAASDWVAGIAKRAASPAFQGNDLAPLWMFPENAVLQEAAELLFSEADSPLSPIRRSYLVHSPLLVVPAYRRSVLLALSDAAVVGAATRTPDGSLSFTLTNGGGGGVSPSKPARDSREVPPDQKRPIRVKDLVAWSLIALKGAPQFVLDWSEAVKDAAVDEIAAFLKAHTDELRAFPARLRDTACPVGSVYLRQR